MDLTCAILIYCNDTKKFLICHANESRFWSLPKGLYEDSDNSPREAAIRELLEETGVELYDVWNLINLGVHDYLEKKRMALYFYRIEKEIPISAMKCTTTFVSKYSGKKIPEVDQFKWVDFSEFSSHLNNKQFRLIDGLQKEINDLIEKS